MTVDELATLIFEELDTNDTAEFATALKDKIMNGYTAEVTEHIVDDLATVGIIVTGIPCKRHPEA